jgi:hypothetical protein
MTTEWGDRGWTDVGWTDEEWAAECAGEEHGAWMEKWAPACPAGNWQRPEICLAHRERNRCELELRVPIRSGVEGLCHVITDEREDVVYVRVILCQPKDREEKDVEYLNCPARTYLEKPLNGRKVFDVESEQELPLFVPNR